MNSGDTDPWSGDDVPVATGLGEIIWDTPSSRDAANAIDAETVTDRATTQRRRLLIPAVAIAAVGIVFLAIFAWPGDSEPVADEPSSNTPAAPTTLDTLPPATTSTTATTVADAATDDPGDDSAAGAVLNELPPGDLPAVLADTDVTTEVLVVTAQGELVTLSLPDGNVTERVDLGLSRASQFDLNSNILVVSPDAAMYAGGDGLIVVPSGGAALEIAGTAFDGTASSSGPIPFGWATDANGASVFVVVVFDEIGLQTEWLVSATGDISPAPAQRSGSFARPIYSLGTRLVEDGGGAYRVDPNGSSNRISSGEILATSETRVLLRECDANRVCTAVLRDYDGGEVRIVELPPSFRPRFFAASLSPGGTALTFADPDVAGERTLIDFDSSDILLFSEQGPELPTPTWSADGSGIFTFDPEGGIRFLDRTSGEAFDFALELGQIQAIATRSPSG